MVYRNWNVAEKNDEQSLSLQNKFGISSLLADVMVARGFFEQAEDLISAKAEFPSPFLLEDMDKAVERIQTAIENEEGIFVFGDYDADGITATALLYSYLESVGAKVYYRLPSRSEEGYGLSATAVGEMHSMHCKLIITVDSGVSSVEEVAQAKQLGIDVVITDHHMPPAILPEAVAIVNPMRANSAFPEKHLSGVGVAFQLVCALEDCDPHELLDFYADLVAIGTVADIMPLNGLNRTLVKYGIELLQETHRPGLEVLFEQSGLAEKKITSESVSYGIAPRLNAAGRMGDATEALRLLLTDDYMEAEEIVEQLSTYNAERQQIEQDIMKAAFAQIEEDETYKEDPVLVVWGENFHQGVIGIVASRLVEKYGKPTLVISIEGNEGKGSGRSVDGFSLYNTVLHCKDMLIRYGGHDLAAGLSIDVQNLQAFRKEVNHYARKEMEHVDRKPIQVDATIEVGTLNADAVNEFSVLAPFGSGNPQPLFLVKNATIDGIYAVQEGKHTRVRLRQNGTCIYVILFGEEQKSFPYKQGDLVDVIVSLSVFAGQAGASVSGRVKDIRPSDVPEGYAPSTWVYEKFLAGVAVSADEKAILHPAREEIAAVYKTIAQDTFYLKDTRPLFAKLKEINAGRILTSIQALLEIGVVELDAETGALKQAQVEEKRNLADSSILQKLQ